MRLTVKQIEFLRRIEDAPMFQSDRRYPSWSVVGDLWENRLFEEIGRSAYITEAGRAALKEQETADEPS